MNIQIARRFARVSMALALTFLTAPLLPTRAQRPPAPASAGPTLSPAQQAKKKARDTKMQKDLQALSANKSLTAAQKQAKYQAMVKAYQADILSYLTPAQRTQVKAEQASQAAYMAKAAQKRTAFMKVHQSQINQVKALGEQVNKTLTAAEKTQIASIRQAAQQQAQTIMGNKSLTDAIKQQQLQSLQTETESKTMAVLDPAQQAKVKQIMAIQKDLNTAAQSAGH